MSYIACLAANILPVCDSDPDFTIVPSQSS